MFGPDEEYRLECFERIQAHAVDDMNQKRRDRRLTVYLAADLVPHGFGPAEDRVSKSCTD